MATRALHVNIVLGARGRLGSALAYSLPSHRAIVPPRSIYEEWWRESSTYDILRYLENLGENQGTVYVAAGIIDPNRSADEHHGVNYLLARNVIKCATSLGFKVVTFGTAMEEVVNEKTTNPYLASKIKLGRFVNEFSTASNDVFHIRLHTLFGGGLPAHFMFLGQMLKSLISRSEFKMSSGLQLREYHYISDDVAAIRKLIETGPAGSVTLTHGAPVTLKDIATYTFEEFNCIELLRVGALPGPAEDNYGILFKRPKVLLDISFRETLPALVDYLRKCVGSLGSDKV